MLLCNGDNILEQCFHCVTALIINICDKRTVTVNTKSHLSQIITPYAETIENLTELFCKNHVTWNLTHHINFQTVLSTHKTVLLHLCQYFAAFRRSPTHRNHDFKILETKFFPYFLNRLTLKRKTILVSLTIIPRGTTPAKHRVLFLWLKLCPADKVRVFICFEITEPQNHVFRIESCRNKANTHRKFIYEKLGLVFVTSGQMFNLRPCMSVSELCEMNERKRVNLDVFINDEFLPCKTHAFSHIVRTNNTRNAQLTADNRSMACPSPTVCHNRRCNLHNRNPIRISHLRDKHFPFPELSNIVHLLNNVRRTLRNLTPHTFSHRKDFSFLHKLVGLQHIAVLARLD